MRNTFIPCFAATLISGLLISCSSSPSSDLDLNSGNAQPVAHGDSIKYVCEQGEEDGLWTTYADSDVRGRIPIVVWATGHFERSGYDQETRCEIVTSKLQSFEDRDMLDNLYIGRFNNHPVMYVIADQDIPEVQKNNILMTFLPDMTINQVERKASQLFSADTHASGPLQNSAMTAFFYDESSNLAIDFRSYLQSVDVPSTNSD